MSIFYNFDVMWCVEEKYDDVEVLIHVNDLKLLLLLLLQLVLQLLLVHLLL
jgi:hypothetical protein